MTFQFEVRRKFIHSLSVFYVVLYIAMEYFFSRYVAIGVLSTMLILIFFYEEIRLREARNSLEKYLKKFTGKLEQFHRLKEMDKLSGNVYMLLGIILSLIIFDLRVAFAVIFMTIFGDLTAALIGKRFGKHKLFSKSWEGTIAGFFANLLVGWIFVRGPVDLAFANSLEMLAKLMTGLAPNITIVFMMALAASFAELYFEHIDDNMSIPIFAGIAGSIFFL